MTWQDHSFQLSGKKRSITKTEIFWNNNTIHMLLSELQSLPSHIHSLLSCSYLHLLSPSQFCGRCWCIFGPNHIIQLSIVPFPNFCSTHSEQGQHSYFHEPKINMFGMHALWKWFSTYELTYMLSVPSKSATLFGSRGGGLFTFFGALVTRLS